MEEKVFAFGEAAAGSSFAVAKPGSKNDGGVNGVHAPGSLMERYDCPD